MIKPKISGIEVDDTSWADFVSAGGELPAEDPSDPKPSEDDFVLTMPLDLLTVYDDLRSGKL